MSHQVAAQKIKDAIVSRHKKARGTTDFARVSKMLGSLVGTLIIFIAFNSAALGQIGAAGDLAMRSDAPAHVKLEYSYSLSTFLPDLPPSNTALALAWSPDDSLLAAGTNWGHSILMWDANGHLKKTLWRNVSDQYLTNSLGFVQGASHLVYGPASADHSAAFSLWDVVSGKPVLNVTGPQPEKSAIYNRAFSFAVSHDQKYVAAAPVQDGIVGLYDAAKWSLITKITVGPIVTAVAFSPDNKWLAIANSANRFYVFNLESRKIVQAFGVPRDQRRVVQKKPVGIPGLTIETGADTISFSPDSRYLLAATNYNFTDNFYTGGPDGAVRVFRASNGTQVADFNAPPPIRQVAWLAGSRYAAFVAADQNLYLWEPLSQERVFSKFPIDGLSMAIAASNSRDKLAVATEHSIDVYVLTHRR
jgi:WD40 repeat protein